jgi:cell division transport system permease protein
MSLYALKEALAAMRRSQLTSFATTATMTVFMFLLGLFLLIYGNLNGVAATIRERVQIEAFLEDSVGSQNALTMADNIGAFPGVQSVSYVDKKAALEIFRQQFGDEPLQALETNPLPASLKIELEEQSRTFARVEEIARRIAELPGVSDVEYGRQWLSRLDSLLSLVGAATLILGVILAISAILIVATTIKLAFHLRREAVEIMRLVGAARGFVFRPFMIEGALYGFLGSLCGILLLGLLYGLLSRRLGGLIFLSPGLLLLLIVSGTALGGLGSAFSLRKAVRK